MNIFLDSTLIVFKNRTAIEGIRTGQPSFFLSSPNRVVLFEEPTLFLDSEFVRRGNTPSINTWSAASDALQSWFQWLQAIRKDWSVAVRLDRIEYRDAFLTAISPRTGQPYETSTVSKRMQVILQFYLFAMAQGWYEGDLAQPGIENQKVRSASFDPFPIDSNGAGRQKKWKDRDLPKTRKKEIIHPFQISELQAFLHLCGPRSSEREGDPRPARDRLLVDLGWAVGLRVEEISSLSTLQFLCLHPDPRAPQIDHSLVIMGKGKKLRTVAVPGWLVEDAISYIYGERAESLRIGKISSKAASNALFLAGAKSSRSGTPICKRRLQQVVEECCRRIGAVKTVEFIDPDTRATGQRVRHKHSIHDLRHTYAVLTYHAESANGNSEPWKKIQAQLGHEHMKTTIDTYLHHVEIFGQRQRFYDVRKMIGIR